MISNYESIDLSDASDIANIFKLDRCMHTTNGTVSEPSDIINGQSVIRVYSSINTQSFGLNSPLIDNLTHISMGLNSMITWDNPSIDIIDQPNIDSTEYWPTRTITQFPWTPIFMSRSSYHVIQRLSKERINTLLQFLSFNTNHRNRNRDEWWIRYWIDNEQVSIDNDV